MHSLVLELTGKRTPRTGLEGKFSVFHACAAGIIFGRAGEHEFSDEIVARPDVMALRDRVQAQVDDSIDEASADVTVTTRDGRRHHVFVEHAIGSLERPMSDDDLAAKFHGLVDPVLGSARADELIATVDGNSARRRTCARSRASRPSRVRNARDAIVLDADDRVVDGARASRRSAIPEPGPRQLLVRVHAAALNRGEFLARTRHASASPARWKAIGNEGAGEVIVDRRATSRLASRGSRDGTLRRRICRIRAHGSRPRRWPSRPGLSLEEASAIPLTYLVSFDMLVLQGRLKAGEWLLVNGVSSGVGVASLQLAKILGARVIGTSGSADKLAALRAARTRRCALHPTPRLRASVMEATGQHGADLIVNTVGGSIFAECLRALAFEGRLATVGFVDGTGHADIDLSALHSKRLTIFGVSNKMRTKEQRAAAVPRFAAEILPHFASGRIRPQIDRVMEFAELAASQGAHGIGRARRQDRPAHAA